MNVDDGIQLTPAVAATDCRGHSLSAGSVLTQMGSPCLQAADRTPFRQQWRRDPLIAGANWKATEVTEADPVLPLYSAHSRAPLYCT